jgi:PAS domain S-box-containing protein
MNSPGATPGLSMHMLASLAVDGKMAPMKDYSFYCCPAPDSSAVYFELAAFPSDAAALRHAMRLLAEHASAAQVQVWVGDVELRRLDRGPAPLVNPSTLLQRRLDETSEAEPDMAIIATKADGQVAYWNRAAGILYGWRAEEALGRNILELTPAAQSRAEAAAIMQSLRAGAAWQGEIVVKGRDGRPFRAFVADFPLEADGGPVLLGVSVRAEDRRSLDRRQERVERRLRRALARLKAPPL